MRPGQVLPLQPAGQSFHIVAEVEIPEGSKLVFQLLGNSVIATAKALESGHQPATAQAPIQTLELLVDRTSIEAFANDGEISSTRYCLPKGNGISVKAESGPVKIRSLYIFTLDSIWP